MVLLHHESKQKIPIIPHLLTLISYKINKQQITFGELPFVESINLLIWYNAVIGYFKALTKTDNPVASFQANDVQGTLEGKTVDHTST